MADCLFHGYGGPGPCFECQQERSHGMEPGTLPGERREPGEVMRMANAASLGDKLAAKMELEEREREHKRKMQIELEKREIERIKEERILEEKLKVEKLDELYANEGMWL